MGYTTTFSGKLTLNKPATDLIRKEISILENHRPIPNKKTDKPASYCSWKVTDDGLHIAWNGMEKFYYYIDWLEYIIKHILKPNGYTLSGELLAQGEEYEDISKIIVKNNNVSQKKFTEKEIKAHESELDAKAAQEIGKTLFKTRGSINSLNYWVFYTIPFLLKRTFISKNFVYTILLIKEKNSSINLYPILSDEQILGKIPARLINEFRLKKYTISLTSITEIIHYNSPLYKWLLKSNQVYCICYETNNTTRAQLFIFENPDIINQIRNLLPPSHRYFFYRSTDFQLIFYILKKFFEVLIVFVITTYAIIYTISGIIASIQIQSPIPLVFSVIIPFVYYKIIYKYEIKTFLKVSLTELFKPKTIKTK